jgi:hypothetical protein
MDGIQMSREIDRSKPLGDATEHDLLIALGDYWGRQEARHLTRSDSTEVRHVCLYAGQQLSELRTHVLRDDPDWRHVLLELAQVTASLQQLQRYVQTGQGGTSHLGDRSVR